jgi:organic hydroperoxide reductase OsmC/OhrA
VALEEIKTDSRTRLEWDDEAHDHHLAASELRVHIRSSSDEQAVRDLVKEAEQHCPVCKALSGTVPMTVKLTVAPAS